MKDGPRDGSRKDEPNIDDPDMSVLKLCRRPPSRLPIEILGPVWRSYIETTAKAACCPPDYVFGGLVTAAASVIGNARWPQAWPGWKEPPHIWSVLVGDSGKGKSPAGRDLFGEVLPEITRRMCKDFPDLEREWLLIKRQYDTAMKKWEAEVEEAGKNGKPPAAPPLDNVPPKPHRPRLCQNDLTIETVARLLATAALKGMLIVRDEVSGWIIGMDQYNSTGRQFYLESWNGDPFRVERQKHADEPIDVPRLTLGVYGGVQPARLAELIRQPDDGFLARMLWWWPEPVPFQRPTAAPMTGIALQAMDKLRLLDLVPDDESCKPSRPLVIPLVDPAADAVVVFAQAMDALGAEAGGLMKSAYGKARGQALRLSLVIEYLWWAAADTMDGPPREISLAGFSAAAVLVSEYLMPMGRACLWRRRLDGGRAQRGDARSVDTQEEAKGSSRPVPTARGKAARDEHGSDYQGRL